MALIKQPTLIPTRKVAATGLAGAVAVALVAVIDYFQPGLGTTLSPTITGVIVAVASVIGGYFAKERA